METRPGQSMSIVGSLPQLGRWKDFRVCAMKWTEGHIWEINLKMPSKDCVFFYKYVKVKDGNAEEWEQGYNRIADLLSLHQTQNLSGKEESKNSDVSNVILDDSWHQYTVNFSIYYPLKNEDEEVMKINGEGKQLGAWNAGKGPRTMIQAKEEVVWLTGMKVRPWEWKVTFD